MTETSASREAGKPALGRGSRSPRDRRAPRGLFGRIGLFISQVLDELRKVVRPTGSELVNYTIVVVTFVVIIMALVSGLDFAFHKLVALAFTSS